MCLTIIINVQIFAIILIFILTKQVKIYSILMLFALLHEITHMITGIILKLKPRELKINPFGISIRFEAYDKSELKKILIAISGPALNIVLAVIFNLLKIETEIQYLIVCANVILGIFNLLPIYPLDGGRIMKSILKKKYGWERAEDKTNQMANITIILLTVVSSILILIYKNIGILLAIAYLWFLNIKENKRYLLKKRIHRMIEEDRQEQKEMGE